MSQFTHAQNITELDKKINAYVARGYEPNELTVFTAQPVPELLQKYSGLNEAIITDETTDASVFKDFTDEELVEVSNLLDQGEYLLFIFNEGEENKQEVPGKFELHEEQLVANTHTVDAGEVNVRKRVKTREEEVDVPIQKDSVTIERHKFEEEPLLSEYNNAEDTDDINVTRIPVTRERIRIIKEQVVSEEIVIRKEVTEEVKHIKDTVQYDDIEVDKTGDNLNVTEREK